MKILLTGTAGFIASSLALKLLKEGFEVIGLDNINDYYDINLKYARLKKAGILLNEKDGNNIKYNQIIQSSKYENYKFIKLDITDKQALEKLFKKQKFDLVCNLAGQAGVRYSLDNPDAYISSNIMGFMNILELCRTYNIKDLLYSSSSSVYGKNETLPFKEEHKSESPISLYAATKKSNELMAHTYSHLFNINTIGLRFFTVYGPYGRPDMALFKFVGKAFNNESIDVYNNGAMLRDFTYIDDVVNIVYKIISSKKDNIKQKEQYKVYNIGSNNPISLKDFIIYIEEQLGFKIRKNMLELQDGDVIGTYACTDEITKDYNFEVNTNIKEGINKFIIWYKDFYKI